MSNVRVLVAAAVVILGGPSLLAQDLSRYRDFALGNSAATVVKLSGAENSDLTTSHERPAKIQAMDWRPPYTGPGSAAADPVHDVQFSFCDDQLYQIVVAYDRNRTVGLTNNDVSQSISATYGAPLTALPRVKAGLAEDEQGNEIIARWEDATSLLVLTRNADAQFQLVLTSKVLNARALSSIKEAARLDTLEAPQREQARRAKVAADAQASADAAGVVNKAAFKP